MKALTAILILVTMLSGCRLYTVVQGDGRVSSPNGTFDCQNNSGDCSEQYNSPGAETLEASASAGHSFRRWKGCDYETLSSCKTNISQSAIDQDLEWTITAVFEPTTPVVKPTTYTYNALGQRITKTEGGTTTIYQYDLQGKLISELDETGHPLRQHVYLDDAPISVIERAAPDSDAIVYYVHTDHLDTPDLITDSKGSVVADFENTPFGVPYINYSKIDYNLGFPGQYYDAENGLHYNYYRNYDARLGRYIQSDPIGLQGGLNTYAYVDGNPLSYIDPDGLRGLRPGGRRGFGFGGGGTNGGAGGKYGQTSPGYYTANGRYIPPSIPVVVPPVREPNFSIPLPSENTRIQETARLMLELHGHLLDDKVKERLRCIASGSCSPQRKQNFCPIGS